MKRLEKAERLLEGHKVDALLITDPISIYYLTGFSLTAGKLLLQKKKSALLVDGRYFLAAQKRCPCEVVLYSQGAIKNLLPERAVLGFDASITTYQEWHQWEKALGANISLKPLSSPLRALRLIKDAQEIALMKRSADITKRGFLHLVNLLKEGIEERELAKEFTLFILQHGAEKLSFDPIIAFGVNSSFPHYRSGNARLKKNDIVLMDLGVIADRYCSDMTRVVFHGKPDPELARVHETVKRGQQKVLRNCKPGVSLGSLDKMVREDFAKEDWEKYYLHSLGHGVGLEIHEFPRIKSDGEDKDILLEEGMVITIEPGIYLPEKGGARHEDTIVITKDGYENFFEDLP